MDGANAQQAPHNVAVLVLPECGAIPGSRDGVQLEQPDTYAGGGMGGRTTGPENVLQGLQAGRKLSGAGLPGVPGGLNDLKGVFTVKKCLRKIGRAARLILVFLSGVMSGLLLVYGMETWAQRDGLPGGEALILPLIILLIYLGWQLGAMWREVQERFR